MNGKQIILIVGASLDSLRAHFAPTFASDDAISAVNVWITFGANGKPDACHLVSVCRDGNIRVFEEGRVEDRDEVLCIKAAA